MHFNSNHLLLASQTRLVDSENPLIIIGECRMICLIPIPLCYMCNCAFIHSFIHFYKNEMHIYAFLLKQPVLLVERGGKRQFNIINYYIIIGER